MPGVVATAYQAFRRYDDPFTQATGPLNTAYTKFSGMGMPPNWTDHPFYPLPTRRTFYSLPTAPP
jgi:hypothetical protein